MKSKELFMLIDQIDRRFVEEAWEGDEESGKPIEIVLERSPFHAVKFFAAVAACIVLFGAGLFTIANIRTQDPFQAGSSGAAESPDSSSESEDTSTESGEISESSDVSVSTENDEQGEFDKQFGQQSEYRLDDMYVPYGDITRTEIVEKNDNYDYAVIYIDETNATEENPIIATIWSVDGNGDIYDIISEKLFITGRGKYGLYYTVPRGAGSGCVLMLENNFKETFNDPPAEYPDIFDVRIIGTWIP